ncbi:MAG: hypothetical protein JKY48_07400 [Flavobacteriales bacterium]|nr:hypothetical protein [Flavobacteriales bacterium]
MATTNTYNALQTLIGSNTEFRFQATPFNAASAHLFDSEFIGGLNLLKPKLLGKSTDKTFKLTGTGSGNPFILDGLILTLEIVNASGLIQSVSSTTPTKPLFNRNLKLLDVDYSISYSAPTYTLQFSIKLDITSELNYVAAILKNPPHGNPLNNFQLEAKIKTPKGKGKSPYLIYAPSTGGMNFPAIGEYQIKNVSFDLLTFVSWGYEDPTAKTGKYPLSSSTIQVTGDAIFEQITKQIDLTSQFAINSSNLFLSGNVTSLAGVKEDLSFNDLLSIVPGVNLSQVLPSNIPFLSQFGLTSFSMGIDISSAPKFNSFHISLATDSSFKWEIIPGILALKTVEVDFGVTISTSTEINASLLGIFELDDNPKLLFDVSGSYPDYVFRAFSAWEKKDSPSITELLQGPLGNGIGNPFDGSKNTDPVLIESVSITVDAKNKSYAASLLIAPNISLSFGTGAPWFKVTEIGFDIKYLKSNFSGDIYGSLIIAPTSQTPIELYLYAGYDSASKSWSFQGNLQN